MTEACTTNLVRRVNTINKARRDADAYMLFVINLLAARTKTLPFHILISMSLLASDHPFVPITWGTFTDRDRW